MSIGGRPSTVRRLISCADSGPTLRRRIAVLWGLLALMGLAWTASGGTAVASAAPYTIGLITDETGPGAPVEVNTVAAVTARIDLQNAHGGVNGHQIKLIVRDDQTSPTENATATQSLLAQGVLAIINDSPVTFGSTTITQKEGVPVVGSATDGYEWGEQPNTNMFSLSYSLWDPKEPVYALSPAIWKGVSPVASFGYSISPSSSESAKAFTYAARKFGLKVGYLDTGLPYGTVNATSIALELKSNHVEGMYLPLDDNTNFAILTSAKQAGAPLRVTVSATGYGQALLDDSAAVPAAQGVYFPTVGEPVELHTAATKLLQSALAKYGHLTGVPDFSAYEGWASADLMIKGLQLAGKTATRASIIKNLRKVTSYNAGGLLPTPINFTQFGKDPKKLCSYYTILRGKQFVVANAGKPVCSSLLPDSDQAPSAP